VGHITPPRKTYLLPVEAAVTERHRTKIIVFLSVFSGFCIGEFQVRGDELL
jgi:hypothetical protein